MARRPIAERIEELKAELARAKALEAQQLARARAAQAAKRRQEETRRKIQAGGLVVLAGLAGLEKETLLGCLLDISDRLSGDTTTAFANACRVKGREVLSRQASLNPKSAAAQTQSQGTA